MYRRLPGREFWRILEFIARKINVLRPMGCLTNPSGLSYKPLSYKELSYKTVLGIWAGATLPTQRVSLDNQYRSFFR